MASKKGTMKGHTIKGGHKRPTKSGAGMTKKGVAKYRRDNPGSKLKTAVTGKVKKGSKAAKRRKSYCARSAGQMKKFQKQPKIQIAGFVRLENAGSGRLLMRLAPTYLFGIRL